MSQKPQGICLPWGRKDLNSVWDNEGKPLHYRLQTMTTTIKYSDLVESVAAALQYIS